MKSLVTAFEERSVQNYDQTLPFYLKHTMVLVDFRDEIVTKFTGNLTKMVQLCREQQALPLVLGLATPLRDEPEKLSAAARRQAANRLQAFPDAAPRDLYRSILDFDLAIEQTCVTLTAACVPPRQLPADSELFFDGVHMNDAGYMELAKRVAAEILSLSNATPTER